ncbi:MAG: DNA translocase FtsK, partial [Coriobacteriales bacterium]|nr:DNA translocase FtsK [Coriobacteriales bacterium]
KSQPSRKKSGGKAPSPKKKGDDVVVPDFLKNPRAAEKSAAQTDPAKDKVVKAKDKSPRPGDGEDGYELPPMHMLSSNPNSSASASTREELEETMERLQGTLHEFGLTSRVVDYVSGPIVTTFRVEMGEGERVSRIRNLEDDIALTLAAEKVRIYAPIPGTSFVGIEIPNKHRQNVHLGDVLPSASGGPLEVAIGRDSAGRPVVADISKMPHMLVAGTTGSGKSVMINSMIMSLLMRTTPKQVRLIMIDPKRVEFSCYNGLPHLYVPVVTEPRQAASALQWAVSEMERRLKVFERAGVREIKVYNKSCVSGPLSEMDNPPEPMPYLVVIIDELSDLMMVAGKDVEASIVRLAQLARAAGIHLVIATQRPSANVVTGLIKSNIDNRIALKVSAGIDSRVILDETGAERLLGNGDMLFKYRGLNVQRVLGCYTSDQEINEVVDFIRDQAEPDYHEEILTAVVPGQPIGSGGASAAEDEDDPLVWEAAQIVVESRLGSTSGLQRRLKVGYARAGRIMDMLQAKGVVGPPDGSKPREVLLDEDELEELRVQEAKYREVV